MSRPIRPHCAPAEIVHAAEGHVMGAKIPDAMTPKQISATLFNMSASTLSKTNPRRRFTPIEATTIPAIENTIPTIKHEAGISSENTRAAPNKAPANNIREAMA
jgi:hypothetical protein